jgi:hypothetical protein
METSPEQILIDGLRRSAERLWDSVCSAFIEFQGLGEDFAKVLGQLDGAWIRG